MLDSEAPQIRLWLQASADFGYDLDPELPLATVGLSEAATRDVILGCCGFGFPYDAVKDEMQRRYADLVAREGIPHRPGLLSLLGHLRNRDLPLAIATSSERTQAEWKLEAAGVREWFQVVVCGDEVRQGKPAPDIYLLAAGRLGVAPEDCVALEDSPAGLRALDAAGIRSIFIKDTIDPPPEVLATVWRTCRDLSAAVELFA